MVYNKFENALNRWFGQTPQADQQTDHGTPLCVPRARVI
jgi:hypothetical protein